MFKAPFSFNGRIRRKEYLISFFFFLSSFFWIGILTLLLSLTINDNFADTINILTIISIFVFIFAQGAKRCHDIGKSGWYILIPFYSLYLLFPDSQNGENEYGLNPKGVGNDTTYDSLIDSIGK